jgi:hypothetical protein
MKKIFGKFFRAVDRVISGTAGRQVLFFLVIVVVVFALLFTADNVFFSSQTAGQTFDDQFWNVVRHYIGAGGFENISNFERVLVLVIIMSGRILFAGVLVALLTNTILKRIDDVKNGKVYYDFSGHFVIIGFDHICSGLVAQLAARNEVVVQTSGDVQAVRLELYAELDKKQKKRVTVVYGYRVSKDDVKKLKIDKCEQVFLLGKMDEDDHDSRNIECLGIINEIARNANRTIRCHVLFNRHLNFEVFQQQKIPGVREKIDSVPFNFCDMWTEKVFVDNSYNNGEIKYIPLDREPITEDSPMRVHLVILGMSRMGNALGIQAAHLCHFPNFVTRGIKTRITFIDEAAEREMNILRRRMHNFFDEMDYSFQNFAQNIRYDNASEKTKFTDLEFEFIEARFEDDAVQQYLEKVAADKTSFLTVAIARMDSSNSLAAALSMPSSVYDSGASVLVRQENSYAVVSMLFREEEGCQYRKYKNLRPFGMNKNSYNYKHTDELLPMMVKYTYDNTTDERVIKEFPEDVIRDNWINNWRDTDNISALKASNRYAANFIRVKQESLGIKEGVDLDTRQINLAARIEHNRWVTEKLLLGFRPPTPEEAANITREEKRVYYKERFIHEDIKAYQELSKDEKGIDARTYDINISSALPHMIKAYREISEKPQRKQPAKNPLV